MSPSFVHLHIHSEYSLSDSIVRIPDKPEYADPARAPEPNLLSRASELGMPALALCDDSNLFALIKFYRAAEAAGIKPIAGTDLWVADPGSEPFRVTVLCRDATVVEVRGHEIGIVGTKGFVGGFEGAEIPDFGEPLLRAVYAETTAEADAIERGLEAIAGCHRRIVLLHYAPIRETLEGEPETIWAFLGSGRLAAPIGAHRPDLVLHGHAHRGSPAGSIGEVPVRNVAIHVTSSRFVTSLTSFGSVTSVGSSAPVAFISSIGSIAPSIGSIAPVGPIARSSSITSHVTAIRFCNAAQGR